MGVWRACLSYEACCMQVEPLHRGTRHHEGALRSLTLGKREHDVGA